MRRRDFIRRIVVAAAGWPAAARGWIGVAGVQAYAQLVTVTAPAAQNTADYPIEVVPVISHGQPVNSVAFSFNGARVLSGGVDQTAKLWDVATGRLLRTFVGHVGDVTSVTFSPDGMRVLSGGYDKTVKLWDAVTGVLLRKFLGHSGRVTSVAFSPDSALVLSGSADKTLRLWNAATGQILRMFVGHSGAVHSIVFSPEGTRVLSGSDDNTVRLWDTVKGLLLRTFAEHSGPVHSVAFSPDGTHVLSGSADKSLKLWDGATGKILRTFVGHSGAVHSVAFSPDGKRVVSGSTDKTVKLWNAATGQLLGTFTDTFWVVCVAFSPDGTRVLSGSNHILKLWDAATGQIVRLFAGRMVPVTSVALSPDGTRVLSGNWDETVKLWDAESGARLRAFTGHSASVRSVVFSRDGARVLSGSADKTLKLWDPANGQLIRTFEGHSASVWSVAFSRDGLRVLSGSEDKTLKLWDTVSGQLIRTFKGHSDRIESVAFSPDGTRLLSGSYDNTVRLWNTATGQLLLTLVGHTSWVSSVAFSPDGTHVLSGSADKTVRLWDAATGRLLRAFVGHAGPIHSIVFSPEGTRVLSGSDDNTVRLWNAATGVMLRTFEGHLGFVTCVAFSRDGARVLSGAGDGAIRIWNASTSEQLVSLFGPSDGEWLAMTPEGFFAASEKVTDSISVVRGLEVYSIDQFYQSLYRPDVVRQKLSSAIEIRDRAAASASKLNLNIILASKAPPEIAIVQPQTGNEIGETSITVEADLADQGPEKGGGIGRVEWRVNDVTRVVQDLQKTADGSVTKETQTLLLPDGTSEIKVVAYNRANLAASRPASISVTVKSSTPRPKPRLYALAVGVNTYRSSEIKGLNYSVADAKSVMAAFELSKSDTTRYADVVVKGIFDEQATAQHLQAEFKRLGGIIQPQDVFALYIAGHGVTIDGRYYFVPHDAKGSLNNLQIETAVGQNQLQEWLTQIPALQSVLIYDSCESGSTTEDRSGFRGLQQLVAAEKLSKSMGRTVLSATSDVKGALEGYPPDGRQRHGFFTYVLLDAFAFADSNNDGRIDTEELAEYVRAKLPALTEPTFFGRQDPQVKLSGAPFPLVTRFDIAEINKVR